MLLFHKIVNKRTAFVNNASLWRTSGKKIYIYHYNVEQRNRNNSSNGRFDIPEYRIPQIYARN